MKSWTSDQAARFANLPEVPTTPAEFLLKVEAALATGGEVARVQGTTELIANGQAEAQWSIDSWFDLRGQGSRAVITKAPSSRLDIATDRVDLVEGDYFYRAFPSSDTGVRSYLRRENPSCFIGEPDSLMMPLACGFSPVSAPASVELEGNVNYGGRQLSSLLWRTTSGAAASETRLLVDPSTYMPVAQVETSASAANAERRTLYNVQFLTRRSLAADFFKPAALGYESVPAQQLRVLDSRGLGVPIYWPGRTFRGSSSQAQLSRVEERGSPSAPTTGPYSPGTRVTVAYTGDSGHFRLDYWAPGAWEEHKRQLGQSFAWATCSDRVELAVASGSANILRGLDRTMAPIPPSIGGLPQPLLPPTGGPPVNPPTHMVPSQPSPQPAACPNKPYDRFMAEVFLPNVTVTVNAPYSLIMEPSSYLGVYNSQVALEELVRSLRPRRTGE